MKEKTLQSWHEVRRKLSGNLATIKEKAKFYKNLRNVKQLNLQILVLEFRLHGS